MKKILMTGASGFVGTYLCRLLAEENESILWGVTRHRQPEFARSHPGVRWLEGSSCDPSFWRQSLSEVRPDVIYHLGGQPQVTVSWEDPVGTMNANVMAQTYMMEMLRELQQHPAILVVGSSEEYGLVRSEELPVKEENPLRPLSPYAVSKVAQDLMAHQYFRSYNFRVVRTRSFNHTGPGRPDSYAVSSFCKQIAFIEAGLADPVLHVGNLKAQRDYVDVRDMVRAYVLAIQKAEPGEVYNICSGQPRSMETVLQNILSYSTVSIRIQQDSDRLRPADLPIIYGDPTKFTQRTGWRPHIPFEQTLQDLLCDWRERVRLMPANTKIIPRENEAVL